MPEFSFIIPVYNGEMYIGECLESLLNQTFVDIEIICVDDCSTDNSLNILNAYTHKDSRVSVLRQSTNRGSARARRRGVLESKGAYVLFADQDDSYERNTCKKLRQYLTKFSVDVLQYDTRIINDGNVEQSEVDGLKEWLTPYDGYLAGRSILDECFIRSTFGYSIWNKAYEGRFARHAFEKMEDTYIPLGEDNYESFVLFYFAKSYRGISDKFYNYHYGRGYTGRHSQSIASFKRTCNLSIAADLIRSFLLTQSSFDMYSATYYAARKHMLHYAFDRWATGIAACDKMEALRCMIDSWTFPEILEYVVVNRPYDLSVLLDARFGLLDTVSSDLFEERDALNSLRKELALLVKQCQEKDARIADKYFQLEHSREYKLGRALTAPLRYMQNKLTIFTR